MGDEGLLSCDVNKYITTRLRMATAGNAKATRVKTFVAFVYFFVLLVVKQYHLRRIIIPCQYKRLAAANRHRLQMPHLPFHSNSIQAPAFKRIFTPVDE